MVNWKKILKGKKDTYFRIWVPTIKVIGWISFFLRFNGLTDKGFYPFDNWKITQYMEIPENCNSYK